MARALPFEPFDPTGQNAADDRWQRYDWRLLINSHVHRYPDARRLRTATEALAALDYLVHPLSAATWGTRAAAHDGLAEALAFPAHYGRNLDALVDALRDVAEFTFGSDPKRAGTVIAIDRFDRVIDLDRPFATGLLDAFAQAARFGALLGHPMLLLIHAEATDLGDVGCTPVCLGPDPD